MFKVNQDNLDNVIILASQGVSLTEVQEGLIVRRGFQCLAFACQLAQGLELTLWSLFMTHAQAVILSWPSCPAVPGKYC